MLHQWFNMKGCFKQTKYQVIVIVTATSKSLSGTIWMSSDKERIAAAQPAERWTRITCWQSWTRRTPSCSWCRWGQKSPDFWTFCEIRILRSASRELNPCSFPNLRLHRRNIRGHSRFGQNGCKISLANDEAIFQPSWRKCHKKTEVKIGI